VTDEKDTFRSPHLHLTVTAQRCCPQIIASAHALYRYSEKLGSSAGPEAEDLIAALDELARAAYFLRASNENRKKEE
jgi:hypothetical protein